MASHVVGNKSNLGAHFRQKTMTPDPSVSIALTAASELTKEASSLLSRMLGPAADEIGEYLAMRARGYLARNKDVVIAQAVRMVCESEQESHEVPLRTLIPLLEGASREDDSGLQARWAALLANAATSTAAHGLPPLFADILSNLTPDSAHVLQLLGDTLPRRGQSFGFLEQSAL